MNKNFFHNRTAVLITNHKKEKVIFPVLRKASMNLKLLDNINTDSFGTFTRDVDRAGSQLEAARYKAFKAIETTREPLAIASEGSFGSHPTIFFAPANSELVLLVDTLNNIEIQGWEISTDTNHSQEEVSSFSQAIKFANRCKFPAHGIVVRPNSAGDKSQLIFKGVKTLSKLKQAVMESIERSDDKKAFLESDMRAMYNPTRMKVIKKATITLLNKMNSKCPDCGWPGFEVTEWIKGLICEQCSLPTKGMLKHIYQCKKCLFQKVHQYPHGLQYSEPLYCDFCNP